MSEKVLINLNGAVIMEQEKNVSDFFKYCEDKAPKGEWEELTLEKLQPVADQVADDLATHEKAKRRWENILQLSKFSPKETEEAYERIEFYEDHIAQITHTYHIFGMLLDIIKLNAAHNNDIEIKWMINEE